MDRICSKTWCSAIGKHKHSRAIYCTKHYRFRNMRNKAKSSGKYVPSWEELEAAFSQIKDMQCPVCEKTMVWQSTKNDSNSLKDVISLQHQADDKVSFVCQSCNAKWSSVIGDFNSEIPEHLRFCTSCMTVKPKEEFYCSNGRYESWCKVCKNSSKRTKK